MVSVARSCRTKFIWPKCIRSLFLGFYFSHFGIKLSRFVNDLPGSVMCTCYCCHCCSLIKNLNSSSLFCNVLQYELNLAINLHTMLGWNLAFFDSYLLQSAFLIIQNNCIEILSTHSKSYR